MKRICKEKALHERVRNIEHTYSRFLFVAQKLMSGTAVCSSERSWRLETRPEPLDSQRKGI
ncbi:MAG: hypothetical protein V1743_06600 [Nanoarchaeota archaeon]